MFIFRRMASTSSLSNKVAIVTASTAGIGLAIAKRLGQAGASVVVSSRKVDNVNETVKSLKSDGLTVEGTACHVGKESDRQKLVDFTLEKFGKIDILVSNAAVNPAYGSILDVGEKTWDKLFSTNVTAAALLTNLVVPHMEKQGSGSIVYVSSITGYVPGPGIMAYGVTKTALLGLTKAMATTLAPSKIRVNSIAPGIIKTDFSKALWESPDKQTMAFVTSAIPQGRIGTPEECSGIVAFLCSDEASYITGENVCVNGGMTSRL